MGDVFKRRCGCGQLIGLRESCARCADKARARLHAEGFCRRDGTGQPYDCGTPPMELAPKWMTAEQRWAGVNIPKDATALKLPTRAELEAAVRHVYGDKWADTLAKPQREPSPVVLNAGRHVGMSTVRKAYEAYEECFAPGWGERLKQAHTNEPPPVFGAEVSWDEAKRDMMARKEARYRLANAERHVEYAMSGMTLVCKQLGLWSEPGFSDANCAGARWVRLA